MTSQTYRVTLWDGSHRKAKEVASFDFPIRAIGDELDLETGLEKVINGAVELGQVPIISVGQHYQGDHSATGWQSGNAITLEWNRHHASEALDRIHTLKLVHYVVPAHRISRDIDKDRMAVVFPLSDTITDKKEFQTVASRLFKDIGVNLLTPGCCTYSFFFKADADNAMVVYSGHDYEGELVDPEYHMGRTGKDAYIVVADYEEAGV